MRVRGLKVLKVTDKERRKQEDRVLIEAPMEMRINALESITGPYIRTQENALIHGILFARHWIRHLDDIDHLEKEAGVVHVETKSADKFPAIPNSETPFTVSAIQIIQLVARSQERSLLYKDTAISESAALCSGNEVLHFAEDIHAENAIYKVLGLALEEPVQDPILFTTSKIDEAFIKHFSGLGISCIVSRTGCTDRAIDYAENKGILLIGFARGLRFNVYSQTDRLVG